jgi:hypothetical protein
VFSKLQIRLQFAGFFHTVIGCFQRSVVNLVVIVADVVLNAFIQFKTIIGGIQVNLIVFQRPPEPFDPDIVQRSSLPSIEICIPCCSRYWVRIALVYLQP